MQHEALVNCNRSKQNLQSGDLSLPFLAHKTFIKGIFLWSDEAWTKTVRPRVTFQRRNQLNREQKLKPGCDFSKVYETDLSNMLKYFLMKQTQDLLLTTSTAKPLRGNGKSGSNYE